MSRTPRLAMFGCTLALAAFPANALADEADQAALDLNQAVAAETAEPAVTNPDVQVTAEASTPTVVDTAAEQSVSLSIPAEGSGQTSGTTTVFDGTATDTQVGVQPTAQGFRALVRLDGPDAPERFEFQVGDQASRLRLEEDGSVTVLNAADEIVGHIETPWARDANGVNIPTHYEIEGLTLTQVVQHRGGGYAYPIVADPSFWQIARCAAHLGAFIVGNVYLIAKIRRAGGIAKSARILADARNWEQRYKAALALFGNVIGIDGVVRNCG